MRMTTGKACVIMLSLILALSLSACALTRMTSWYDQNYKGGPIKKTVVFGLFKDSGARALFEKTMVTFLNRQGIPAVASYNLMPPNLKPADRDREIQRVTHSVNGDGILIFRVVSIDKQVDYALSNPRTYSYYYWRSFDDMQNTGYETRVTDVILDIRLFSNTSDLLVWSATSETFDPNTMDTAVESIGRKMVASLREHGLAPVKK